MAQQSSALPRREPYLTRTFHRISDEARTNPGDLIFRGILTGLAAGTLLLVLWIIYQLFDKSQDAIREFGLGFITSSTWNPVKVQFGALPFIFGTVVTSAVAIVIATPIGLGAAIFLAEYAPGWLRTPLSFLAELLAAIPSIVYGLWGI